MKKAGGALVIATCVAVIGSAWDAYIEREADRADRLARLEQQQALNDLRAMPTEDWFLYESVDPIAGVVPVGTDAAFQSTARIDTDLPLRYRERYRCRAVLADGSLGRSRLYPAIQDVSLQRQRRIMGAEKPDALPEGYSWSDGEWIFSGPGPSSPADCELITRICVDPHPEVEKCQRLVAGVVQFRDPSDAPLTD